MKKIIQSLTLVSTLVSPLCFANVNGLKVATIKEMYSQSQHDINGKWVDGAPSDTELLNMYGGVKLKNAMLLYENNEDDGSLKFIECAETYPSLFVSEPRDDFNKIKVSKIYSLTNGRVRADIKAYSMHSGKIVNYKHDFSMICKSNQCLVNDVYSYDEGDDTGYSLVDVIYDSCKR